VTGGKEVKMSLKSRVVLGLQVKHVGDQAAVLQDKTTFSFKIYKQKEPHYYFASGLFYFL